MSRRLNKTALSSVCFETVWVCWVMHTGSWQIIPDTGSRDCKTAWSIGYRSCSRHQQIAMCCLRTDYLAIGISSGPFTSVKYGTNYPDDEFIWISSILFIFVIIKNRHNHYHHHHHMWTESSWHLKLPDLCKRIFYIKVAAMSHNIKLIY